ncbi:hypothetical protein CVIRNUC_011049 [Coccomyxa viridis]|uniref:Bacterial Ig-like domain-containing protein n=1 Tax=Coccomyxa viridis TaxID=1274662 RepID=A0AAV1INJ7_9CHLO|nr:hypothetical protein CVIRNUC_011049 [Coccomyxa viridis]
MLAMWSRIICADVRRQMLSLALILALQGFVGSADGVKNGSHHQPWTIDFQVPTSTIVTLNGTVATANVFTRAGLWKDVVSIIPKLLGACPQGQICWKTVNGGPCLANTSIQAPTSGNRGSIGQASFNYATTPGNEAAFSAMAGYQGSALCKAAPSQGSATRVGTSLTLTSSSINAVAQSFMFTVTLTSAASSGQPTRRRLLQDAAPISGQVITISFGDGSPDGTVTTNSNGTASIVHRYTTHGTYKATARYTGSTVFLASHAMGLVQNGMLSSSVSLANNPAIPVATEQVTFTATVASGAAGTMVLANLTVELAYGDGSTDTSTTNSNGQAMFNHTYATAGSFPVVASFAGNAAYSGSSTSESLIVDLESSHLGLLITPNPAFASEETTFNVTITSGGPGSPRLAGKTITLDYGEAYMSDTTSSSANGVATFTHTYCRFGDVTATATFAGNGTYSASSVNTTLTVKSHCPGRKLRRRLAAC